MTAQTNKERQQAKYAKKRAAGLVPLQLWPHREDVPPIKKYAADLALKREKQDQQTRGKK